MSERMDYDTDINNMILSTGYISDLYFPNNLWIFFILTIKNLFEEVNL